MFRFRLGAMMMVVLVLGVGFAAIRAGTPLWAAVFVTLALLVLSAATVGAALRRGRPRAAWGGFAFFGWVYLLLSLGPGASEALAPHLLTTHAIDAFLDLAMPEPELQLYGRVLTEARPGVEPDFGEHDCDACAGRGQVRRNGTLTGRHNCHAARRSGIPGCCPDLSGLELGSACPRSRVGRHLSGSVTPCSRADRACWCCRGPGGTTQRDNRSDARQRELNPKVFGEAA